MPDNFMTDWWQNQAIVDFVTAEVLLLRRHEPGDQLVLLRCCYDKLPPDWQKLHRLTTSVWLYGNALKAHEMGFQVPTKQELLAMNQTQFLSRWVDGLHRLANDGDTEPLMKVIHKMMFKWVTPVPRQVLIELYRLLGLWEKAWQVPTLQVPVSQDVITFEWTGQSLIDRSILLDLRMHPRKIRNNGWGDIINFCWLPDWLYRCGAKSVGMLCDRSIEPLLRTLRTPIVFNPAKPGQFDFVSGSVMNCLTFSKWTPERYLPPQGYLSTPVVGQPKPVDKFRVALCWATGDLQTEQHWQSLKMEARNRSMPFHWIEEFLLLIPDIEWISLQADLSYLDAISHEDKVLTLKPLIKNWSVTARWLISCDLLISVDTAVAHLGGALGVPTAVLLQKTADWRWQRNTDKSMFYPSIKLFRQLNNNDWREPMEQVAAWVTQLKRIHAEPC